MCCCHVPNQSGHIMDGGNHVIVQIAEIRDACIVADGKLTPGFEYIAKLRESSRYICTLLFAALMIESLI
jgi:hypothetical protein